MATIINRDLVVLENVLSVYSGKDGHCCCGCSGKHYYSSKHTEKASTKRGYLVTQDEVSDKMVKKVVNIINRAKKVESEKSYFSTVIGSRLYIAYID